MGYFLTTEPENAVLPNFCASPKTHTPDPRVSERGQRFYMPEIGRWASRDPIGEKKELNLLVLAVNDPLNRVDVLGLQSIGSEEECQAWAAAEFERLSAEFNEAYSDCLVTFSILTQVQFIPPVGAGGRLCADMVDRGQTRIRDGVTEYLHRVAKNTTTCPRCRIEVTVSYSACPCASEDDEDSDWFEAPGDGDGDLIYYTYWGGLNDNACD